MTRRVGSVRSTTPIHSSMHVRVRRGNKEADRAERRSRFVARAIPPLLRHRPVSPALDRSIDRSFLFLCISIFERAIIPFRSSIVQFCFSKISIHVAFLLSDKIDTIFEFVRTRCLRTKRSNGNLISRCSSHTMFRRNIGIDWHKWH